MSHDARKLLRPDAFDKFRTQALSHPETRAAYEAQALSLETDSRERYARAGGIGRLLREARVMRGRTQADQAAQSGVLQSEISRIEAGAGTKGPSMETIVNYAHSLDMDVVVILKPRETQWPASLVDADAKTADKQGEAASQGSPLWGVF